jgi:hypothetical protein
LSSTTSSFFSFLLGLIAGLTVNGIVAFIQRPSLEILSEEEPYDGTVNDRFLHVRVRNKKPPVFNRNAAVDCESAIWIADADTRRVKDGSPFKTKWARLSTIVFNAATSALEWRSVPAQETRINIYPGHSDGGKEGLQLDVVLKTQNVCLVHDPELYRNVDRRKWQLPKGRYYIKICIRYAQKASDPRYFLLINDCLDNTKLTPLSGEELAIARGIFSGEGQQVATVTDTPDNPTTWRADYSTLKTNSISPCK